MRHFKEKYGSSFTYALLIHAGLISLLFISLSTSYKQALPPPSGEIVQATLWEESKVRSTLPSKPEGSPAVKPTPPPPKQEPIKTPAQLVKKPATPIKEPVKEKEPPVKPPEAKQKEIEENQLAQIQLAKEKEKKELEALRAKKIKEEKRLAALEEKRLEEQERANHLRLERQKEEKRRKDLLAAKKKAEEEKKASQARAAEEARWAAENAQHQQWVMNERDKYKVLVRDKIKGGWLRPEGLPPGLSCSIKINASPDGSVHSVNIIKSSGNVAFDQTTAAAVRNATPLPFPPAGDPELTNYFLDFTLDFKDDGEITEYAM